MGLFHLDQERATQSLNPSWKPRVPGVENSDGPAQRVEAFGGQGQGPHASRQHHRAGNEGEEAKPADISPESNLSTGGSGHSTQNPSLNRKSLREPSGSSAELHVEKERLCEALCKGNSALQRPTLLELERFERRALEHKAVELKKELKGLSNLWADSQCLKDKNAALICIFFKVSK